MWIWCFWMDGKAQMEKCGTSSAPSRRLQSTPHAHAWASTNAYKFCRQLWMEKIGCIFCKEWYCIVYKRKNQIIKSNKWDKIWNRDGLPNVNFFLILAHQKALTAKDLRKRGIVDPLRCIFFKEGSFEHVFIECNFTQKVWSEVPKN